MTDDSPLPEFDARHMALGGLDMAILMWWWEAGIQEKLYSLAMLMVYADTCGYTTRSKKRRKSVDVDALVEDWLDVLIKLATAHDPDTRTRADHRTDDLLTPLLTAPIEEIRDFVQRLTRRLREDERVPFMVWSAWERIVEPVVLKGPDGGEVRLRTGLAEEIAGMVEQMMERQDLVKAIAGALQWRSPVTLEKVKSGLQRGAKPSIQGRESCLFLEVDGELVVL